MAKRSGMGPAWLLAAGLMLGMLGAASLAQAAKSSPLPEKLQGNYTLTRTFYLVVGRPQRDLTPSGGAVAVGSAGLTSLDFTEVLAVAGIGGNVSFEDNFVPSGLFEHEGTVSGTLKTDTGTISITGGSFRARLGAGGLQLLIEVRGTMLLGASPGDKPGAQVVAPRPTRAVINIVLKMPRVRKGA